MYIPNICPMLRFNFKILFQSCSILYIGLFCALYIISCWDGFQDRENIERLEITGVGDPSGRGLGFSYVRVAPKAPVSSAVVKKKATNAKGTTVTGTDADLRRLSMDAARVVCLTSFIPWEVPFSRTLPYILLYINVGHFHFQFWPILTVSY